MAYKEVFQFLVDIGLVEVLLPFFLVFTITYGVLQRTNVFGMDGKKPKKKLNAMVAFVMGFFAVLATNLLNIINIILFYFVLLIVIGLLLALVLGLAGGEVKSKLFMAIMLGLMGLFFLYALAQAGMIDEDNIWLVLLLLLLFGGLIWGLHSLFKEKKKKTPSPEPTPPRPPGSR